MTRTGRTVSRFWLLLVLSTIACTTARLVNPPRVSFAARDMTNVEQAIITGMSARGWVPYKESDGSILATLNVRTHQAVVRIQYGPDWYDISYVKSANLDYQQKPDGAQMIHRNYNGWVQNLRNDIAAALGIPPPAS